MEDAFGGRYEGIPDNSVQSFTQGIASAKKTTGSAFAAEAAVVGVLVNLRFVVPRVGMAIGCLRLQTIARNFSTSEFPYEIQF